MAADQAADGSTSLRDVVTALLDRWCNGLLGVLIDDPGRPDRHGGLGCPACGRIHGRCIDAVHPLLERAHRTGDERYLAAAKAVFSWSSNVSNEDGSWAVVPEPGSWTGVTVFGAVAFAEALHFHGDLLDAAEHERWMGRLEAAADHVLKTFDTRFSNINYAATAVHALDLIGELLDRDDLRAHSRALAQTISDHHFTEPNRLLWGEGKPTDRRSAKGLPAVDLGYNVEESLNSLALFAVRNHDKDLIAALVTSLRSHLAFMLPDGGWDNSWGTRQAKWTYWGSRTTDGCHVAYALLGNHDPAFTLAVQRNVELLARLTGPSGLLPGGLHFRQRGLHACVHHTFSHARSLATLLDRDLVDGGPTPDARLPRDGVDGVVHFPEIDVWLATHRQWRATVTSYDNYYAPGVVQPAGGSLSLLWHESAGPVCLGSMPSFAMVEPNNQQPQPDAVDLPLTPRVESWDNGRWATTLYDLAASVAVVQTEAGVHFVVSAQRCDADFNAVPGAAERLEYDFTGGRVHLRWSSSTSGRLVLPIIAPEGESLTQVAPGNVQVSKPGGVLRVTASAPISWLQTPRGLRHFNIVPGADAASVVMWGDGHDQVLTITWED